MKAALSILSELTPEKLALSLATGDSKAITKAQGSAKACTARGARIKG